MSTVNTEAPLATGGNVRQNEDRIYRTWMRTNHPRLLAIDDRYESGNRRLHNRPSAGNALVTFGCFAILTVTRPFTGNLRYEAAREHRITTQGWQLLYDRAKIVEDYFARLATVSQPDTPTSKPKGT